MKYYKLYITTLLVLSNIKHLHAHSSRHQELYSYTRLERVKDDIAVHVNEAHAKAIKNYMTP